MFSQSPFNKELNIVEIQRICSVTLLWFIFSGHKSNVFSTCYTIWWLTKTRHLSAAAAASAPLSNSKTQNPLWPQQLKSSPIPVQDGSGVVLDCSVLGTCSSGMVLDCSVLGTRSSGVVLDCSGRSSRWFRWWFGSRLEVCHPHFCLIVSQHEVDHQNILSFCWRSATRLCQILEPNVAHCSNIALAWSNWLNVYPMAWQGSFVYSLLATSPDVMHSQKASNSICNFITQC